MLHAPASSLLPPLHSLSSAAPIESYRSVFSPICPILVKVLGIATKQDLRVVFWTNTVIDLEARTSLSSRVLFQCCSSQSSFVTFQRSLYWAPSSFTEFFSPFPILLDLFRDSRGLSKSSSMFGVASGATHDEREISWHIMSIRVILVTHDLYGLDVWPF